MTLRSLFACVLALYMGMARPAIAVEAPDLEIAKRHYGNGLKFYDAQDYASALHEFQMANETHPAPELTYNIARCFDRLEQRPDAIHAYAEFLAAQPYSPNAPEVRERIAVLAQRNGASVTASPDVQPVRHRYRTAIALGVTSVALAGIAGGLLGGATQAYDDEKKSCAPGCSVSQSAGFLRLSGASTLRSPPRACSPW